MTRREEHKETERIWHSTTYVDICDFCGAERADQIHYSYRNEYRKCFYCQKDSCKECFRYENQDWPEPFNHYSCKLCLDKMRLHIDKIIEAEKQVLSFKKELATLLGVNWSRMEEDYD
jgi:hypothetical protein